MKVFYVALSLVLFFAGYTNAQSLGEKLTDKTGMFVHYADNANLLLKMEDHRFKMFFLDDADTVIACPFRRVIIRADNHANKKYDFLLVFHGEPGATVLTNDRFIKPPYSYTIHVMMYPEEEGDEGKISIPSTSYTW